ncbi:fatty acyl-ACP thioesterases B [Prunus dulcis]|uniref:Acyl-[acyl-carrier-protein] hydrolase n=1 Tax=Prunus dulcis TaxID=3755 RepID=A0A5H2XY38_PRUDU|nr:fatty acyl-ACP thioesterases B [Prunus dulcis]
MEWIAWSVDDPHLAEDFLAVIQFLDEGLLGARPRNRRDHFNIKNIKRNAPLSEMHYEIRSISCCYQPSLQINQYHVVEEQIMALVKKIPQHLNWESRKFDWVYDTFGGKLRQGGLVFQQNFSIRSYDLGPDGKATIGCLMERLLETSVQHCRSLGLYAGGFGSTPEMTKRGLVWVMCKLQTVVEKYPSWAEVIQIDTCTGASGNNGLFRDWIVRDYSTGQILIRATAEITDELRSALMDSDPLIDIKNAKLGRLDIDARNYFQTSVAKPGWSDLDVNQHVSSAKYIDWVFKYRSECRRDSAVQSLTAVARDGTGDSTHNQGVEFDHLLRLETGSKVLRARTVWKPICDGFFSTLKIPAQMDVHNKFWE